MNLPFIGTLLGSAAAGPLLPVLWTVAKLLFRAVRNARDDEKKPGGGE